MAIDLSSIRRVSPDRPPVILIHGGPGIGKTTFAAQAPGAVFIRTEDGLGNLTADAFPIAASFQDVLDALGALFATEHPFQWVVVDSLSALEPLIWRAVCAQANKRNIEELGFGKGYIMALDLWQAFLEGIAALAAQKKVGAILIAHTTIKRYESPETEAYDRAQIKLHERAFQLMYERADVIGYAAQEVFTRRDSQAKGEDGRVLASTGGQRFLNLVEKPAFVAKNRYGLPERIALDWAEFYGLLMQSIQPQTAAPAPALAQAA